MIREAKRRRGTCPYAVRSMGSPSTVFLFPSGSDREIDLDLAESSARVLKSLIEVRYPFHRATGKWVLVLAVVQALWGVEVQQYFGHASKMFHRRSKNRCSSLAPLYANLPPSKGKSYPLSYHSNHSVTISYSYYPPKKQNPTTRTTPTTPTTRTTRTISIVHALYPFQSY